MDKLSNLIQEAKPLYKKRQHRKKMLSLVMVISMPVIFLSGITSLYLEGNDVYLALEKNNLQTELLSDEFELLGQ